VGVDVEISIEIRAKSKDGFDESVQRAYSVKTARSSVEIR
jgi:hypothetical protein